MQQGLGIRRSSRRWAAAAACTWLALAAAALPAAAAGPQAAAGTATSRYQAERAACLAGQTGQDRATCLKEAAAARDEARRQRLDGGETPEQWRANALLRCQRQPAADRPACERMVQGEGTQTGSVASGGVLRELTTRETASQPAAAASR